MRRRLSWASLVLLLAVQVATGAPAGADEPGEEAEFVSLINGLRAGKGLAGLTLHDNLVSESRGWSATMSAEGQIWHSTRACPTCPETGKLSDGITADWLKLGENVGMGGSVRALHDAFIASPKHYDNLVDPRFTQVGIGITHSSGGVIFVTETFMQVVDSGPPVPAAPAVQAPPPPPPPAPVVTTQPPAKRIKPAAVPRPAAPTPPPPAPVEAPAPPPPPPPPPPPEPSPLLASVLVALRNLDAA